MGVDTVPTILPPIISADYGCDAGIKSKSKACVGRCQTPSILRMFFNRSRAIGMRRFAEWAGPFFTGSIFTIPSVTSINPPMLFLF
jgi:hypothetical protein